MIALYINIVIDVKFKFHIQVKKKTIHEDIRLEMIPLENKILKK